MRLSRYAVVLFCVALLAGCHSSRKSVPVSGQESVTTLKERFDVTVGAYRDWQDVTVPVNVDIVSPKGFSISGRVKMVRGKSVDISLRMLGFEVGRVYATTDSVFGMIKPGKAYMAESLAELLPDMPFTLGNLQDMLTGRMFIMGSGGLTAGSFRQFDTELTSFSWIAVPKKHPAGMEYGFTVSLDNLLRSLVLGVEKSGVVAQCDYGTAYSDDKAGMLMSEFTLKATAPRQKINATLSWRWDKARWNEGASSSWSIPKGYRRVKAADLIKSI